MSAANRNALAGYELLPGTISFLERPKRLFIGNESVESASETTLDVEDPASEQVIASVPAGNASDIDRAVAEARAAFETRGWRFSAPADREAFMLRLADALETNAEEMAQLITLECGKPIRLARTEVEGAVSALSYFGTWARKIEGTTVNAPSAYPGRPSFAYTRKEPVGIVGVIVPWNYPLLIALGKAAPAMAAGCTVVVKPAEQTPLACLRFAEIVREVGLPPGVFNVVTGLGETAGAALAAHRGVNKVTFTGSTSVGKAIGRAAADNVTRVCLELGGKSPMIVLADADVERSVPGLADGIFSNSGQDCTAGSRLLVHRSIYEPIVAGIVDAARKLRLGPGLDESSDLGPLVSRSQQERVLGYIASGLEGGAELVAGGGRQREPGYFVEPTVFCTTNEDLKIVREEIFGPVLVATPYSDEEEALRLANDTRYGLAASIWSNDLSRVHALLPRIDAGIVWVNGHSAVIDELPFGGVKESGIGRECAFDNVDMFLETKSVMMFV
jgi:phenylacetaldehyde dehydrogenase